MSDTAKKGIISFTDDEPIQVTDLPDYDTSAITTDQQDTITLLGKVVREYREAAKSLLGGHKDIQNSLRNMYRQEPDIACDHGYKPDPQMAECVGEALQAAKNEF